MTIRLARSKGYIGKLLRIGAILGLILSLLLVSFPAAADPGKSPDFASDHILVKFKPSAFEATKQEVHRRESGSVMSEITPLGIQVVKIPAGEVQAKINAYRSDSTVEFAEPDFIVKAIGAPSDTYFSSQWGLAKVLAPEVWDITTGNSTIKIAILDTGVSQSHPDLAAKIVANQNFATSGTADDIYGHGTHVAGIAAAITNNGIGVAGIGYNSSIMNVKVLGDDGSGYDSWVAQGIIWAADNGAKVINLSLGGPSSSAILQDAIDYAWQQGAVIVAAAGNEGSNTPFFPAYYDNCISVAATDPNDVKAGFSNYGSWVDVAAPGVSIYSTLPNSSYGYLNGTSMATPEVSGLAALVWATSYGTSNANVCRRIEEVADDISQTGSYWQYGRINAYEAVTPTPTVVTENPSNITAGTARLNGELKSTGIATSATASFQWGTSSGNYTGETTAHSTNITGNFYFDINSLSDNTTYYFRAKTAGSGDGLGQEKTFTTSVLLRGDANIDGRVDIIDVIKVERIIIHLEPPTLGADANSDGLINADDVTKVERIIVGLN